MSPFLVFQYAVAISSGIFLVLMALSLPGLVDIFKAHLEQRRRDKDTSVFRKELDGIYVRLGKLERTGGNITPISNKVVDRI